MVLDSFSTIKIYFGINVIPRKNIHINTGKTRVARV
jgi:hypothetical protein